MNSSATKPVKIYLDYLSQPCRAILALCYITNIPYEVLETRINKLQTRTPEFKQINYFGQVPVIDDDGFILAESHAILTYLLQKYASNYDSLYPQDLQKRAIIDSYLNWHNLYTRKIANLYWTTLPQYFPNITTTFEEEHKVTSAVLNDINNYWLADTKFLKSDVLTIADISAICEINHLQLVGFDFSKFPLVQEWMKRCFENQGVKDAHKNFDKLKIMIEEKKRREAENAKSQ